MKKRELYALGLLLFLVTFTALNPVFASTWGDPLVTDTTGDGSFPGEDILWVDARYANEFIYFRFKMNDYLHIGLIFYMVILTTPVVLMVLEATLPSHRQLEIPDHDLMMILVPVEETR